jgi:hypothetical protein
MTVRNQHHDAYLHASLSYNYKIPMLGDTHKIFALLQTQIKPGKKAFKNDENRLIS